MKALQEHRKYMETIFASMTIEQAKSQQSFIEELYRTEEYLLHQELLK